MLTAHGKSEMKTHAFIHFRHYIHVVKVLFIHHMKVFHHFSAQSLFSCIVNLNSHSNSYENILTVHEFYKSAFLIDEKLDKVISISIQIHNATKYFSFFLISSNFHQIEFIIREL